MDLELGLIWSAQIQKWDFPRNGQIETNYMDSITSLLTVNSTD